MATPITIKKGFQHAAEFFGPGREADLLKANPAPTPEQLANWQKRGLIAIEGAETPAEKTSESAVLQILKPYVGESGEQSEDEVGALVRIIRERDEAEDSLEEAAQGSALEKQLLAILDEQGGPDASPVERLQRLIADRAQRGTDFMDLQQLVASMHAAAVGEVRGPIRGVVEDVEDVRLRAESAEAQVKELTSVPVVSTITNEKEQTQTDGQTEAKTQGQVIEAAVTAEELTKLLGNAKTALALLNAGFSTREKLRAATDADFDKIEGVGDASRAKIREFLAA